ncbi:replication/maintenance protein RepL [Campylobacter sp. 19-13652]|uniref:replication/maintenance protein RepL n=1 Tax=Campylobacter sp. 19-13652 TaxID=2840180 RepID=UPI001C7810F0|nr:replication/maintenance protein RepL [Campylobacter sp. 19-13652]BCX78838.1 hypothetical protein LBC_03000 [Campylobacter sp. 19-13652]
MDSSDYYEALSLKFYDEMLGAVLGIKKLEVIKVLAKNADDDGLIRLNIAEIMELSNSSKPTVIATLNALKSVKILKRIKNGVYKITPKSYGASETTQ